MAWYGGTAAATAPGASGGDRKGIVFYWTFTALLIVLLGAQGILMIARPPMVRTLIEHLGYPPYFPVFLGMAKLLAAIAIVQSRFATLKEWAYAGITFDLLGAALSHLASHDQAGHVAGPFLILGLVAASYFASLRIKRRDASDSFQGGT